MEYNSARIYTDLHLNGGDKYTENIIYVLDYTSC